MKDHPPATRATDEEIERRARAILASNPNLLDTDVVREARDIMARRQSSQDPGNPAATAPGAIR
jgi:hypothetical protein